ncbi:MAG: winged helix DNA-binding protein [Actinobacteria bacterium]|nr:winged helix DNA-binding protein [Actinomycetota bacterium]
MLAGSRVTARTPGAVAEQLSVNESTASRLVDATVRAGLIDRGRSEHDARRVVLALTEQGRQLCDRALRYRLEYLSDLLDDWSPDDRAAFARLLGRFAEAVHPRRRT